MNTDTAKTPENEAKDESVEFDRIDEEEDESFPASDPHSSWAGPPN
ncbi:MAG TPA: hypothetical protein VN108_01340 [Marmoricola sp.]|nr:hypothetical protein [Marmoricola sp.]